MLGKGVDNNNMKQYNHREITQILRQNGYTIVRQTKHQIWSDGVNTIPVPLPHNKINFKITTKIYNQIVKNNEVPKTDTSLS